MLASAAGWIGLGRRGQRPAAPVGRPGDRPGNPSGAYRSERTG
jgi:hypothetical protein